MLSTRMLPRKLFGVRRQSEAATALWLNLKSVISESKAVSRYAYHRTPKDPVATARGVYH